MPVSPSRPLGAVHMVNRILSAEYAPGETTEPEKEPQTAWKPWVIPAALVVLDWAILLGVYKYISITNYNRGYEQGVKDTQQIKPQLSKEAFERMVEERVNQKRGER